MGIFVHILSGSGTMEETKKNTIKKEEEQTEKKSAVAVDWAETASQELSDYIEEQGIQIRY